jgi:hypothetical protein
MRWPWWKSASDGLQDVTGPNRPGRFLGYNLDMKSLIVSFAIIGALISAGAVAQEQSTAPPAPAPAVQPVPAYHTSRPAKGEALPPLMTPEQLASQGFTEPGRIESYKAAAKIPAVFYQLPCYCYCDRGHGHTSLHSCFETAHGANCGTCMAEALYAYQMSKKGETPKQIRDGSVRGEYKSIDLLHPEPVL